MRRKHLTQVEVKEILKLASTIPAPTQYDIDRAKVAAFTCRSMVDFEEFLELDAIVFRHWCDTSNRYKDAVFSWRNHATKDIEVAMAKRAVGFTKKTRKDIITRAGTIETLTTETYYPPDPTAAQFWLKNRAPQDWQDKKEIDVNVNANIRAWLVAAGATSDSSEIIDGTATLIEDQTNQAMADIVEDQTQAAINSYIAETLDDGTATREAEMLEAVAVEVTQEMALIDSNEPEAEAALTADDNQIQDEALNNDATQWNANGVAAFNGNATDPLAALNSKWR